MTHDDKYNIILKFKSCAEDYIIGIMWSKHGYQLI